MWDLVEEIEADPKFKKKLNKLSPSMREEFLRNMEQVYDKESVAMVSFLERSRTEMMLTADEIFKQQESDRLETERLALRSRHGTRSGIRRNMNDRPAFSRMSTKCSFGSDSIIYECEKKQQVIVDPRQRWQEKKNAIRQRQLEREVVKELEKCKQKSVVNQQQQQQQQQQPQPPPTMNSRAGTSTDFRSNARIDQKLPIMTRQKTLPLPRESSIILPGTPISERRRADSINEDDLVKEFEEEKDEILKTMQSHELKMKEQRERQAQLLSAMKEKRKAKKDDVVQEASKMLEEADVAEKTHTEVKTKQFNKLLVKLNEKKKKKKKKHRHHSDDEEKNGEVDEALDELDSAIDTGRGTGGIDNDITMNGDDDVKKHKKSKKSKKKKKESQVESEA